MPMGSEVSAHARCPDSRPSAPRPGYLQAFSASGAELKEASGMPDAGLLPLPTMTREVSGRASKTRAKHAPPKAERNRNIQVQPNLAARTPPRTGPKGEATLGLWQSS